MKEDRCKCRCTRPAWLTFPTSRLYQSAEYTDRQTHQPAATPRSLEPCRRIFLHADHTSQPGDWNRVGERLCMQVKGYTYPAGCGEPRTTTPPKTWSGTCFIQCRHLSLGVALIATSPPWPSASPAVLSPPWPSASPVLSPPSSAGSQCGWCVLN